MSKKSKSSLIWWVLGVVILGGLLWLVKVNSQPGKLDSFARCLKDKGATFYGAFWCPHCQNQKALFGKSQKFLPYVECSTPDGNGQNAICQDKKIDGYPTWEFADGSRESGEAPLEKLSAKTGCSPPK